MSSISVPRQLVHHDGHTRALMSLQTIQADPHAYENGGLVPHLALLLTFKATLKAPVRPSGRNLPP